MKKKRDGTGIVLTVFSLLLIVVAICSTGSCNKIAEALGTAVDNVLFDNPEQVEIYKEAFGK